MRRLFVVGLVVAWALAARAAEFARPVQLSLDFSAPSPAALPTLAVPQSFYSGDPAAYLAELRATAYVPPASDDAQQNLLREGLEREAADRAFFAQRAAPAKPAAQRATKLDYAEFGRRLDKISGLSSSVFDDVEAKRAILKGSGYTHLYGPGGVRLPIDRAEPVRVGKAFEHARRALLKRRAR